jgi:glycosyltransferase involved in cell wall biosynthesis
VEDGKTGLQFDHRESDPVKSLAGKLDEVLSDWPRMLAVGEAAQQSVQRFGFRPVAEQFLTEFEAVLAGNPAPQTN